jgi:uncharacterized protein
MKIVADTNVIVSALVFGGLPRRVFELVEVGVCEFYYSSEVQDETRRVLGQKFGWDEPQLDTYLPRLWSLGSRVVPRRHVRAVTEDPTDNRILECAIEADAHVIVTGDAHLLKLREYQGIAIRTPRQFLGIGGR